MCIGPAPPAGSYLNITSLVAAAEITGADAVHPGYGFLAENAHFAEILEEVGLKWIGPSPDAIRRMGDKAVAKETVGGSGVPTVPGSPGPLASIEDAMNIAERIGYPGPSEGGRRRRRPRDARGAARTRSSRRRSSSRREAERAFGNGSVYLEKYLARAAPHRAPDLRRPVRDASSTSASGSARSRGAIRRSSRNRRRRRSRTPCARRWGPRPSPWRRRWTTSAPAPWSSSWTRTARSTSWR